MEKTKDELIELETTWIDLMADHLIAASKSTDQKLKLVCLIRSMIRAAYSAGEIAGMNYMRSIKDDK